MGRWAPHAMAHRDVWDVLATGELDALKAVTPYGFDWRLERCPKTHCTPLQAIINGCTEERRDRWLQVAAWLMDQGADPTLQASEEAISTSFWEEDNPVGTEVTVRCAGRSAISTALRLREKMEKANQGDWVDEIDFLSKLVALFSKFSKSQHREQAAVELCVVDRWERMLCDEPSHDVVFTTADGPCTAHSSMLKLASPVLKASLESAMLEGQHKRIVVADATVAVVNFFLELMYTGGSCSDVDATVALGALELAHRWQVDDVVMMTERLLESLLADGTFEQIAGAAQRMQLRGLRLACASFAARSASVKQKLRTGALPPVVLDLLAQFVPDARSAEKKRRRMF